MDPNVARAISLVVGHPGPFRDEELDSVVHLGVGPTRGIAGLEGCRSLRVLVLSGYGGTELPDFSGFRDLQSINVADSDLRDIGSITKTRSLMMLHVERTFVSDISAILECPALLEVDVTGNPLSETSFREVLPELRARGIDVTSSAEREWSITCALHRIGLPFAYYEHGDRHRLSRPGLERTDYPQAGHITVTPEEIEHLLATNPEQIERLFDRLDDPEYQQAAFQTWLQS